MLNHFVLTKRPRRLRQHGFSRALVQQTRLHCTDLIYPLFLIAGQNQRQKITSMPSVYRYSLDLLIEEAAQVYALGIPAIALFPVIEADQKSLDAKAASDPNGLIQCAVVALKRQLPDLGIITDVALDPYTTHGQDGLIDRDGNVLNDETVKVLVAQALSHAQAGADIVAPSDMMDGRVGFIRQALEENGYINTKILAYSAKYASNLYGPFREAVCSAQHLKGADKKTYQMDIANSDEAMLEIALDLEQGADIVMVKPALAYLDVIWRAKQRFGVPTFAYQVSGEYSMLMAAIEQGFLGEAAIMECLLSIKRAGADAIMTYFAKTVAASLNLNR